MLDFGSTPLREIAPSRVECVGASIHDARELVSGERSPPASELWVEEVHEPGAESEARHNGSAIPNIVMPSRSRYESRATATRVPVRTRELSGMRLASSCARRSHMPKPHAKRSPRSSKGTRKAGISNRPVEDEVALQEELPRRGERRRTPHPEANRTKRRSR
jgi:hypothetical protein